MNLLTNFGSILNHPRLKHSMIQLNNSRSLLNHSEVPMNNSRVPLIHSSIPLNDSRVSLNHSKVPMKHLRIVRKLFSIQNSWRKNIYLKRIKFNPGFILVRSNLVVLILVPWEILKIFVPVSQMIWIKT